MTKVQHKTTHRLKGEGRIEVSIRKISNGFIKSTSHSDENGYLNSEEFVPDKPEVEINAHRDNGTKNFPAPNYKAANFTNWKDDSVK